ncbi:MAG TPA: alpha-2-macroglobulin family protein [Blastocatellia bacterium]|nr:alpha-2-macroglobulin family protein [Blastocatellia bacterium]
MVSDSRDNTGLIFRLSEDRDEPQRQTKPQIARPAAEPLSGEAAENLLKRLPPIKAEGDDQKDFALRDRSLPPPRTGQTIDEAFPPAGGAEQVEQAASGPLEVLRVSPEGDVPIAPHLSVTFSQPMVAVTSNEDLSAAQVPVKLWPQPQGKWRWLGTKTLLFEPAGRFPMATDYTVEIPSGTKSAVGGSLAAAKRWTFSTPAPQAKSSWPTGGPHSRNPLFFIEFDQRIDPNSMLKKIRLNASGRAWTLRLATGDEIAADENVSRLAKAANKDYWIAFRAVAPQGEDPNNPLPANATHSYTVAPGAPSAEGPGLTTKSQSFSFSTHGPLFVKGHRCGYDGSCPPGAQWMIEFNNQLDVKAFDKSQVRVTPELPGLNVTNYGNWIYVQGRSKGRTVYNVTLDASIRDIYGQTMGENRSLAFRVGDATPNLAASGEGLTVLDPYSQPKFSIFSVNHRQLKVSLYAVTPEHWSQYATFMRNAQFYGGNRRRQAMPPIGRLISSKVIDVENKPDEMVETQIDLRSALNEGLGHVIVDVDAVQPPHNEWERRSLQTWIQATNIGLDAFADQSKLIGWATSLKDGKPLGNVEMAIANYKAAEQAGAKTGANGLANFALPTTTSKKMLLARSGKDVAFLPEDLSWWDEGSHSEWRKQVVGAALKWHVFDDRGMYRPDEEVHVKGWLRKISAGLGADLAMAGGVTGVQYSLKDSRGNEVLKGSAQVNTAGGFDMVFKLPKAMNLGYSPLMLTALNAGGVADYVYNHTLRVEEFRRPEYEVKTTVSEGPHFVREHATLTVAANYYAGGGLADSEVRWNVSASASSFTPPNRGDFSFGKWTPWWEFHGYQPGANNFKEFTGRTDASGKHSLRIDFDSVTPPRATTVTATANVQDVNRQNVGSSFNFLVHPADLYVGLRTQRWFVQKGEPLVVESIVTDLDGKAIANREIRMRAALIDWTYEKGEWKERETDPQECVIKSGENATQCRFEPREGGRYRVTARIYDDRERPNETELTLWVAGGKQPPQRDLAQEKVELIPSAKEYKVGDTAEILVQAPFFPAEGVLTLRRSGLVTTERFTMDSASQTLKIPINEEYLPNIHVQVDLAGASSRPDDEGKPDPNLPKRPAFASGTINLSIPPVTRKLTLAATPRDKEIEPGGETTVDIELRDAAGKPAQNAEVALVVVDESVLALTGYNLADPLETFYFQRGDDVRNHHSREQVQLAKADGLIGQMEGAPGAGGGVVTANMGRLEAAAAGAPMPPSPAQKPMASRMRAAETDDFRYAGERDQAVDESIRARIDFNALAFFAASLPTDAGGRTSVKVKLPDNLTRYRVMAVAVAGEKQFGAGESAITARLPIMARPSAPRFLNFGDRVELPVVVQNQTDKPLQVDVAVRAANAQLVEGQGRRVTVPANDRVEVRFPATTTKPGRARFQIAAASGKWADAAEVSLPVWTPATTEAFATYGEIDAGAIIQPVKAPSDAFKQFGGLEVSTSSTQLQALTDAVLYLTQYPYECAEQISSRVMAVAALRDVLGAFDAKGLPKSDELVAAVDRDIKRLQGMQNPSGGFGFWRRDSEAWPYLSVHVAHALQRAKEKGFKTPPETLNLSRQYLRKIEQHIPHWYSEESRRAIVAYALYVRNRMADRDAAKARSLITAAGGVDKLSMEALGWLMPVLAGDANSLAAIRDHLNNRAEETAGAAHFTTSYTDGAQVMLHSRRRADGIILESLIGDSPKSDLIPKIVRGLLAHRQAGRWDNTQENCFVLLALDRYFEVYEKATPDFVARAWLGDAFAGSQEFRGRTTDRHQIDVPMSYLMDQSGAQNLVLSKEGAGRLYYRIGMNYSPTSLQLKPADYGFTVTRVYEAIDDPNDVRRQEDGTWRIKAGAQIRVRLTMVANARRYHVALVDPLPAGFETLNPELAITGSVPQDQNDQTQNNRRRFWWRQWYEHQNLRDERVEAFTSLLWEGVYNYSYVARATTPGVFVVPPSKAEEMYHPETFGRGATDRVIVE